MKLLIFVILSSSISVVFSEISEILPSKESLALLKKVATSEVGKQWSKKLASRFSAIRKISKKFEKIPGPVGDVVEVAGDIIDFVLEGNEENQNDTLEIEYLRNITMQLDKIDAKLDAISEQITSLESKLSQSTKKIIAELKFRDFLQYLEDLAASKQHYESIISSFVSNSTSLVNQLDKFIEDYRQKGSDTKLVNILDSGAGIANSIVDDLITLSRSYHKDNAGSSGSSTMKTIYDTYIMAFMAILKANIILDSAVNLKTAITGQYYEEDRRYNHYRRNEILQNYFKSLKKTFSKLNEDDTNGFIDFTINGKNKEVRMINVIQYFWENEDKLSIIDTCSDDCEHFKDRRYSGGGCYGNVKDCKFAVSLHHEERYLRQMPQYDRIYEGYVLNSKWYGRGKDDDVNQKMEHKKSYLRGFFSCHVCKCICDQHSYSNTRRKIYAGKVSAPNGFVITGVRFIEANSAIYLQIEVGKLLPMAMVDQDSVKWLPVPDENNFVTFNYDKHKIDFGDPSLIRFSNGVVTGIQFESTYSGASWSIYGRILEDFNRGILGDEIYVSTSQGSSVDKSVSDLIPGISADTKFMIEKNKRIDFGISNEEIDAGQSFVPYFDGNDVTFDIKSPLSGITLIHYTNDNRYAGYIRPVIMSLEYNKIFKTTYEPEEFISAISEE